jgi:ssDNA-binding Zn-finger/Zn-ribbon topoisomerase 1
MACYKTVDDMKYRNFLAVRRFIKCNFGVYDNRSDIDEHKNFNFEFVNCPQINFRGQRKKSMLHSVNSGMVTQNAAAAV